MKWKCSRRPPFRAACPDGIGTCAGIPRFDSNSRSDASQPPQDLVIISCYCNDLQGRVETSLEKGSNAGRQRRSERNAPQNDCRPSIYIITKATSESCDSEFSIRRTPYFSVAMSSGVKNFNLSRRLEKE